MSTDPKAPARDGEGPVVGVQIDRLAPGGDAVGRQLDGAGAGRATFVALAAPGDRIEARLTREQPRVAWADLVSVVTPSPSRVPPPCPLFGRCGGCQWQHVDLPVQRAAKREIAARALALPLERIAEGAPVVGGRGYRDRARVTLGEGGAIGFHAWRSHDVVDVADCMLLSPPLQAALAAIRATSRQPPGMGLPSESEIDLQAGREGVHVALSPARGRRGESASADRQRLGERLLAAWRTAGVVGVTVRERGHELVFGLADVDIAAAGEPPLRVPAGAFAQVGAAASAALIAAVRDAVRLTGPPPVAVLELHAGSGNFTRHLLADGATVMAADADAAAVDRGRRFAAGAAWSRRPPARVDADVVLVDPPREGLDPTALAAALQARRRIVYVSCDPQTLGRDAKKVIAAGFRLTGALALDLMPHTFHIEVVATFDR